MSEHDALLIIFGLAAGFWMGWVQAWRLARKLERHEVVLAEWDEPFDAQQPKEAAKVIGGRFT